jgi:uncharacterized LabA/DUF88 family protein
MTTAQKYDVDGDRTAVFIDGANLYSTAKMLNFDIDFSKLHAWLSSRGRLLRIFYYTAVMDDEDNSPIRALVDWLDYNGYTVVTKPAKEFMDANGRRKIKGNMDIELAVDMMEIACHVDRIILFSGDGDFRRLIDAIQKKGVSVTVVSTIRSRPAMIADELRRLSSWISMTCAVISSASGRLGRGRFDTQDQSGHRGRLR